MINSLTSVSIDEFLQRIGSQPTSGNTWSALITANLDSQQLVDDLQETLTIFAECEVGCFSANDETNTLVDKIINTTEDYLILWKFEQWDKNNWYEFDGCWFDFAILVDENIKPAEIIAFDFEIRFLEDNPTKFLRFDLNLPEHNNDNQGKRFHLHPGNNDLMIHASPMSPLEILHLFLYDLKMPERPRGS
jgi:hypothetical protein